MVQDGSSQPQCRAATASGTRGNRDRYNVSAAGIDPGRLKIPESNAHSIRLQPNVRENDGTE